MILAISASEATTTAEVDPRFGRAKSFVIYNTENDSWQPLENSPNLNAVQGAGIQAAEMIVNNGVNAVLTGHCGPKAFRVLSAAGVQVYTGVQGSVEEAIENFKNGRLTPAQGADVEGHW